MTETATTEEAQSTDLRALLEKARRDASLHRIIALGSKSRVIVFQK